MYIYKHTYYSRRSTRRSGGASWGSRRGAGATRAFSLFYTHFHYFIRIFTILYAFSLFYTHFYYFIRIFYHFASIFYAHHTHSRTSHTRHVLYTHVLRASRALRHALRTDARTRSCVNASMRAARMPTRASAFDAAREYCARVRYEGGPRACCG